ncbi:hypothetical protein AFK68_04505 [Hydrocoleum sp. CS-953]|nr:hypothetical protein AFK68_04505 [Hydrocoleum sp. CS-953]
MTIFESRGGSFSPQKERLGFTNNFSLDTLLEMSKKIYLGLTQTKQGFNFNLTKGFLKIGFGSILLSNYSFPKT